MASAKVGSATTSCHLSTSNWLVMRVALQKRFNFGRAGALFNRKTLQRAFTKVVFDPTGPQHEAAKVWAAQVRHLNFRKAKETSVRGEFIQTVLVTVLGYTPYRSARRAASKD
jgi:hypothetical protein